MIFRRREIADHVLEASARKSRSPEATASSATILILCLLASGVVLLVSSLTL